LSFSISVSHRSGARGESERIPRNERTFSPHQLLAASLSAPGGIGGALTLFAPLFPPEFVSAHAMAPTTASRMISSRIPPPRPEPNLISASSFNPEFSTKIPPWARGDSLTAASVMTRSHATSCSRTGQLLRASVFRVKCQTASPSATAPSPKAIQAWDPW